MDISSKPSETKPLMGNNFRYDPPANKTRRKIANKKAGIAYPIIINDDVQLSKFVPSLTAFLIPNGMDIKYAKIVDQSPSEIETGIFSFISSIDS